MLLFFVFVAVNTNAQDYSNLELIENKGQWPSQVKFKAATTVGAFYLQADGYKMLLHDRNDLQELAERNHGHSHTAKDSDLSYRSATAADDKFVLHSHAYEMKFLNASSNPQIIPDKPLETYNNYFIGNDPSKWASRCRIFQALTYKNVYPGVDLRYYTDAGQLKYDIIVNPGASVENIAMRFDGVDGLEVNNDNLVIKTSVDDVKELRPYTFQPHDVGKKEISNRYEVKGNTVRFKLGAYDKSKVLVIDPQLVFSTFSGSTADNWGYTATYDAQGNFYGGGIVFGSGFPVSTGAFQTTFQGGINDGGAGGYDIGIIKLNPTGTTRIYATYIGGARNEQPHSLVADAQGNLIIAGRTNSTLSPGFYPGTLYGPGGAGDYDIVLTKLSADGTSLIGSRRIGGASDDGVNIRPKTVSPSGDASIRRNYGDDARSEVILDASGNVYLASCTKSSGFPVTAGAFQPTFGGSQDGILIKASPDLSNIIFSSFFGGSGDDACFVLALNPSNQSIFTAGGTTSTNLPGRTNSPVISSAFQGGTTDGYIANISNDGSTLIRSSYLGTTNDDIVYGVQFDRKGYPYVMGTTKGSWPILNVAFSQSNGKQFISKLRPDLSAYEYSTVFGTGSASPNISPVAFLVDRCENVYVSGWGGSLNSGQGYSNSGTVGLTVTSNALQNQTDATGDFYYFVLEKNGTSQLYGSFFGALGAQVSDHVDGGTSRFDENGVMYQAQCGFCGGGPNPFPTTPGSWSTTNRSSNCNLAMIKISFDLAGVKASVKSSVNGIPRNMGCIPLTVDFSDTLAQGVQYIWNFGDGTPDQATATASNSHTYPNIGSYQIRLISIDSATCNIRDTSYTTINVRQDIAKLGFTYKKLPPCDSLKFEFTNTSFPSGGAKAFTPTSFRWVFGDGATLIAGTQKVQHTYASSGTYIVRLELVDTGYCNYPDAYIDTVRLSQNVDASFTTSARGCAPYNAVFTNTSLGGRQFFWDFGDGSSISTAEDPTHLYSNPGSYTIKLTVVDSATCNIVDSTSFTITVNSNPAAAFIYFPKPPQINTAVEFINNSTGAVSYLWNYGDGDSLYTIRKDTTVKHFYNATGIYQACLIAYNQFGCTDTACDNIAARAVPALDVPNAFTPNGDGVNDKVFVRGFAIAKMAWRIYNRWGTIVFTTNNRQEGWDGKYKGALQPQEVYTYTLDIQFSDGSKASKTGDITLLR
jgi:gliding motility-associated-like protein